jgi:Mn2+/Fe2+ NRAMP family transporter
MTDAEKNARSAKIFFWLGLVLTIVGVMIMIMVAGELFDGILGGSRAHGTTRANDVVGFYIGVAGQFFFGLIMLIAGVAFIRNKQPAVKNDTETNEQK